MTTIVTRENKRILIHSNNSSSGIRQELENHIDGTLGVHGIADTSLLEVKTGAQAKATAAALTRRGRYVDKGAAKTAPYAMAVWDRVSFDTTAGVLTQPLPATDLLAGDEVQVFLAAGTNVLTLTADSGNLTLSTAGHGVTLLWTGTAWVEGQDRKTQASLDSRYAQSTALTTETTSRTAADLLLQSQFDQLYLGANQPVPLISPTSVVNTTTSTVFAQFAIAGDAYSMGEAFQVRGVGKVINNTNAAVTVTPKLTFGSTTFTAAEAGSIPANTSYQWELDAEIVLTGLQTQTVTARLTIKKPTGDEVWSTQFNTTENTSATKTFSTAIALSVANASFSWGMDAGYVLQIPPSPSQVAPVLWFPDYGSVSAPTNTVEGVWYREQEPNNPGSGGALQTTRISILDAANVPGVGFADGSTTSGSNVLTLTGTTNNFAASDVGKFVQGPGIPGGTTITTFTDTKHVVMSNNATATASPVAVLIGRAAKYKPIGNALSVFLLPKETVPNSGVDDGDVQGGQYNRAEVYDRFSLSGGNTDPTLWPDPVGSERWYLVPVMFAADHPTDPSGVAWFTFTQWKGQFGGSPPLALEMNRANIRVGGTRQGNLPSAGFIGAMEPGKWSLIVVGIKWSTSSTGPGRGWVEAWRNGVQAMPRQYLATMDTNGGNADPIYFKQGIYRSGAWTVPQKLLFGPSIIGRKYNDVMGKAPDLIAMT